MNQQVVSRRIPPSIRLTDNDCHEIEGLLTEILSEIAPGIIPQITKTPLPSGMLTEITFRKREEGVLS